MKKTLKLTALVMAVAILVCAFAGCTAKLDKLIVGKWSDEQNKVTVEFKDDGTFVANGTTYHYEVDASNANKAKSTDNVFTFEIKSSGLYVERYDDDMGELYTGTLTKA